MSILEPETLEEKIEEEIRIAGNLAGFCPNNEWIKKVTIHLINKFSVQEK